MSPLTRKSYFPFGTKSKPIESIKIAFPPVIHQENSHSQPVVRMRDISLTSEDISGFKTISKSKRKKNLKSVPIGDLMGVLESVVMKGESDSNFEVSASSRSEADILEYVWSGCVMF
ncbi:hypothetical protein AVEN_270568-1 [Araneus ventricosus]|uniref:Uncharacterized protein n=1 Tax=Araneus ventricosus TaxID=182803 RepID=A0A4Y2B7Q1_ARAVE|nr:hypothetical protein AVEN_270568-1 [Araneus ventricosus]